jgi:hypothetical protein
VPWGTTFQRSQVLGQQAAACGCTLFQTWCRQPYLPEYPSAENFPANQYLNPADVSTSEALFKKKQTLKIHSLYSSNFSGIAFSPSFINTNHNPIPYNNPIANKNPIPCGNTAPLHCSGMLKKQICGLLCQFDRFCSCQC